MAPRCELAPTDARAPPPHQINSWPFVYEPTHEIRTRAYPFIDLIWTIDLVSGAKSMDSVYALVNLFHAFSFRQIFPKIIEIPWAL
jgi:hypothetical protein